MVKKRRKTDLVELALRGVACLGIFIVYILFYGSAGVFVTIAEDLSRAWELA